MTDFVVVHGSWHGAWCWERVVPELTGRGHRVVAVELGLAEAGRSFDAMVQTVERAVAEPERTVLVAHSGAGVIAPLVARRTGVRELVLLAPIVPGAPDVFRPDFLPVISRQRTTPDGLVWDPDDVYTSFYQDCDRADADLAINRLVPRQITALAGDVHHVDPKVPTRHIVCTDDRAIDPAESARLTRERYGATIVELAASHSPFWSRPRELARLLTEEPRPARA